MITIYQIRNTRTDRCYFGQTKKPRARQSAHFYLLKRGKHHSVHLQHAWNQDGEGTFRFEILLEVPDDLGDLCEQMLLDETRGSSYNIAIDARHGRRGLAHSAETKEKIAQSKRGKKLSEETKRRMSNAHQGRIRTPEHCANLSRALTGHVASQRGIEAVKEMWADPIERARMVAALKKAWTPERRQRLSEWNRVRWAQKKAKDNK